MLRWWRSLAIATTAFVPGLAFGVWLFPRDSETWIKITGLLQRAIEKNGTAEPTITEASAAIRNAPPQMDYLVRLAAAALKRHVSLRCALKRLRFRQRSRQLCGMSPAGIIRLRRSCRGQAVVHVSLRSPTEHQCQINEFALTPAAHSAGKLFADARVRNETVVKFSPAGVSFSVVALRPSTVR